MGQREVEDCLKENGVWMSANDISRETGIGYVSVSLSLNSLINWGVVECKRNSGRGGGKLWRMKPSSG